MELVSHLLGYDVVSREQCAAGRGRTSASVTSNRFRAGISVSAESVYLWDRAYVLTTVFG